MNKAQEEAWFGLLLGVPLYLIPCGAAVFISYDRDISSAPLLMLAYIACCSGLPYLFRRIADRGKKEITYDERDQLIGKRSALVSHFILWLYFVVACIVPWWVIGPKGSIPVITLPVILIGGLVIFAFVQSLATLIQYGWGGKDGEK
jgi:hypothetical protein